MFLAGEHFKYIPSPETNLAHYTLVDRRGLPKSLSPIFVGGAFYSVLHSTNPSQVNKIDSEKISTSKEFWME